MLWFVQLSLTPVLLLSTALIVVEPLSLARSDVLCPHTVLDEDYRPNDERYRGILIENESDLDDNDYFPYTTDDTDPDPDGSCYDEQGEDRSASEWKKVRRYIKRQLKVPRRYLKKFVRKLTVASKFRTIDGDDVPADTNEMNVVFERANGQFDAKRLLIVDSLEPLEYLALVEAPRAYA